MAKVQYAYGESEQMDPESGRFIPGDLRPTFYGVDGEGDSRYEARFLGMLYDNDAKASVPYFLLTTTDYQEKSIDVTKPRSIKGQMWDATGFQADFYAEDYRAKPGFTTLVIGKTKYEDYFRKFTQGNLKGLSIWNLSGVKKWQVMESD